MIERTPPELSVGAQCRLLSISRSSYHCAPQGESAMNLDLMPKIDKQCADTPFYGARQMIRHLQNEAPAVNEKRIRRLMRLMRLMPIDQKPNTSKPAMGHKTRPCLPGRLRIDRPNQVRCSDITDLPMRKGFLYLVAIMDWFTRKVLAWRTSNTLEAGFCLEALNEAIHKFGPPEIMNTGQGSQGGLHRSSQHPFEGGCHGQRQAKIRTLHESGAALTRASWRCAPGRAAAVLGIDCGRPITRGRCR